MMETEGTNPFTDKKANDISPTSDDIMKYLEQLTQLTIDSEAMTFFKLTNQDREDLDAGRRLRKLIIVSTVTEKGIYTDKMSQFLDLHEELTDGPDNFFRRWLNA